MNKQKLQSRLKSLKKDKEILDARLKELEEVQEFFDNLDKYINPEKLKNETILRYLRNNQNLAYDQLMLNDDLAMNKEDLEMTETLNEVFDIFQKNLKESAISFADDILRIKDSKKKIKFMIEANFDNTKTITVYKHGARNYTVMEPEDVLKKFPFMAFHLNLIS